MARNPYTASRDALLADLRAAFGCDAWADEYPGRPAPAVTVGGSLPPRTHEVAVSSLPAEAGDETDAITCQRPRMRFEWPVSCTASGADFAEIAATALDYAECVRQAVMADPTLRGTVEAATTTLGNRGATPKDGGARYDAYQEVLVTCQLDMPRRKPIFDAVRDSVAAARE